MMATVHIDDAVAATIAALTAEPGVYNVVEDPFCIGGNSSRVCAASATVRTI
jgi:hypothetical protein